MSESDSLGAEIAGQNLKKGVSGERDVTILRRVPGRFGKFRDRKFRLKCACDFYGVIIK